MRDTILRSLQRRVGKIAQRGERGQSMVEMALAFPILLLVLAGTLEVGKYFNDYLTLLDSTREAARYAADSDIALVDLTNHGDCNSDYYHQAACLLQQNMYGLTFDKQTDDIVVSAVSMGTDGHVKYRFPRSCGDPAPPAGMYQLCDTLVTSSQQGWSFCQHIVQTQGGSCAPKTSLLSNADIESRINTTTMPNTGLVVVEVYHVHNQFLGLIPPGLQFLPQQVMMHAYTIMPVPSAAPPS